MLGYFLIIFSYVLGSIPNALWIGKLFKRMDIREYGSGNIGSTNAARVLGYGYGVMTLILDVSKGLIPVYIAIKLYPQNYILHILVSMGSIIGHSYSIFLKFKGGKAVATSLGVFIILSFKSVLVLIVIFILIVLITGYVSVASMTAASLLFIFVHIFNHNIFYTVFAMFIGLLVIYRHKSNILNLLNGTEAKFKDKADKN
ncbi:glycerol-3-phosphate 1-O-acyltransferase PlsY [Caviibacter abscessus]|uniref:glycerol-3-phosphate 1-O-acyltransferase PlsY n=1 Tax=Caviibacter abscessus TaxID=1766719 RepID=UPI000833E2FB|nr:glycerol-3-phosphate 1-O-acyltransferase PlsY [Caviibacter abscessus]